MKFLTSVCALYPSVGIWLLSMLQVLDKMPFYSMKPPLMDVADSSLPGLCTTCHVIHHFLVVVTHCALWVVIMCANLQQEVFSLIYHPFDLWGLDSHLSHLGLAPSSAPGKANAFNKCWTNVWMCASHSSLCYWKNRRYVLRSLTLPYC